MGIILLKTWILLCLPALLTQIMLLEEIEMYEIISSLIKYLFITIIYLFLFGIIRLIYLDIRYMNIRAGVNMGKYPYLKLINRRDSLNFKVEESYILNSSKTFGRGNKNSIEIQDPFMSDEHASLDFEENGYFLKDIGSTNGTFVNNNKILYSSVKLKNGDKIQFGQLNFLFVDEDKKLLD